MQTQAPLLFREARLVVDRSLTSMSPARESLQRAERVTMSLLEALYRLKSKSSEPLETRVASQSLSAAYTET